MIDQRLIITIAIVAIAVAFRIAVGGIFKSKLRELVGHQILANAISSIFAIGLLVYLLYLWNVIQALPEIIATLGVIGAVLLFTMKDIWISNIFAGISLIGDKHVNLGTEVAVGGVKGKVTEMTLTVTKLKTAGGELVIVPNKKFREEIVAIKTKR